MMPVSMPLYLYRGDTGHWQFILWQDTAKTQPADLTGVTAAAQIRTMPGGQLKTSMDCTIELPNIVDCMLSAQNSMSLTTQGGSWDLQLTYPSGDVLTIVAGYVMVTMDVTGSATP